MNEIQVNAEAVERLKRVTKMTKYKNILQKY